MTNAIAGSCTSMSMNADNSLHLNVNIGFTVNGTATNDSTSLDVAPPTTLTAALFNLKIQDAVKTYVNSTYGTSFLDADVILLGGVVSV